MKIRTALLTILGLAATTGAHAQSSVATRNAPVQGNAPNVCVMQQARLAAGAQINFTGLNGSTLQIETLVDPQTLATRAASANIQFNAVCNFPHRLRVEAQNNGLFRTTGIGSGAPNGFAYAIPYTARVNWGPQTTTLNADAQSRQIHEQTITVAGPTAGLINLRLEIQAGASNVQSNAPVLAGNYGDTLRVFLEPQR
jgi:hypothetical protein